jgi:hypothetical protein
MHKYGHKGLARLLSSRAYPPFDSSSRIIVQSSSIGALYKGWVKEFMESVGAVPSSVPAQV